MKKKIFIVLTLFLMICACVFIIPNKKASASEDKIYLNHTDYFNPTIYKYVYIPINNELTGELNSSYCTISFGFHDGELNTPVHSCYYEQCEGITCHNITTNNEYVIIEFYEYQYREEYLTLYCNIETDNGIYCSTTLIENNENEVDDSCCHSILNNLYSDLYNEYKDLTFTFGFIYWLPLEEFSSKNLNEKEVLILEYVEKVKNNCSSEAEINGFSRGHQEGSKAGYNVGYDEGYDEGLEVGYQNGRNEGYNDGYNVGKLEGQQNGENVNASFGEMILDFLDAPRQALSNILNFEFLGINIANLVFFILTLLLVVVVIKLFI